LCPSEYSVLAAFFRALLPEVNLSWNSLPVQSVHPVQVSPSWVRCSHFAVGPHLGCVVFLERAGLIAVQRPALSSLRVSRSSRVFFRPIPADQPQPVRSSHGLFFPSAHTRLEDPLAAGVAYTRYVPPSGFDYPPDGLRPSNPVRFCFTPAALLGFSFRSPAPAGYPVCFHPEGPTYRFPGCCSRG
jgi:hypothetical protein